MTIATNRATISFKVLTIAFCFLSAHWLWPKSASNPSLADVMPTKNGPPQSPSLPLKVFLMVGQSNMQGHGYMEKTDKDGKYLNGTLPWMIQTQPDKYGKLQDESGHWISRQDVWIAYNRQQLDNVRTEINQHGPLIPGYGGDPGQQGQQLGPELGFGWTLGEALNGDDSSEVQQQILLLKIAWGGRSLANEFRPPSSGKTTGLFYEAVIANTWKTLSSLESLFPEYDKKSGYELAGFAWHQGWNDGCDVNMTKEYEYNLANLIRDIRRDLNTPNLPVSIGVSGFQGYEPDRSGRRSAIVAAQFAVANATKYPEFAGTVKTVDTRAFKRGPPPASPGGQVYHWYNNCETYWLIGEAMAKAMLELIRYSNEDDMSTAFS
jgi:alpha-galactosidase